MNTTKTPRKVVSIVFAALVVVMLTLSACIVDPNALAGTSSAQQVPIPPQVAALQQQLAVIDGQIKALTLTMQQRNQQIQQLNQTITTWKTANPGKTPTPEIQQMMNTVSQLNSANQTDMLKLQQLMAQYAQLQTMISNILYQTNQALKGIIGKMP